MKSLRHLLLAAALAMMCAAAGAQSVMLNAVTVTGVGADVTGKSPSTKTYQAVCKTTSGAGTAVVVVEGSVDAVHFDTIGTITLTTGVEGTAGNSGSFTSADRYVRVRGNVTTLTGTGASCTLTMGWGG